MQNQESRLNPIPLPMVPPPNSHKQVGCLENVLDKRPGPVIRYVSILQRFGEWDAKEHGTHHETVRDGQNEYIASDKSTKVP